MNRYPTHDPKPTPVRSDRGPEARAAKPDRVLSISAGCLEGGLGVAALGVAMGSGDWQLLSPYAEAVFIGGLILASVSLLGRSISTALSILRQLRLPNQRPQDPSLAEDTTGDPSYSIVYEVLPWHRRRP